MSESAARASTRLVDVVYEQLRNAILTGALDPGARLKAASLAEQLQVSRGPVRLALQRLAGEGLVVERPHTNAVVRELTGQDLVDLQNTRIGIERIAFALATRAHIDTERLHGIVKADREGPHGPTHLAQHEVAFHDEVFRSCHNETLAELFHAISGLIAMAHAHPNGSEDAMITLLSEHERLIDTIEAGDDHAAAAQVARHISSFAASRIESLGGDRQLLLRD